MAKKPKVTPKPFTPARVKKLAARPGTRSKIPDRLLPEQYRAARAQRRYLDASVAPGSSLTNRQLSRDTKSYITQKYAQGDQAETQAINTQQGLNRDTTGWYDQYLNDLRTHARNIGTFADQNVAQTQGAGQGIASAGTQALAGQTDPISRGINAQAADTRARYAGSFAGQASAVGTADKNYASNQAYVVGPGQKLQAQAQGGRTLQTMREKAAARADAKGADAQLYRSGRISEEQKILTASMIADGKNAKDIQEALIRAGSAKTVAQINQGSKTPPVPYYTWAQWKSMTPAQKRAAVKDYQKRPTKPKAPAKPKADKGGLKSNDPQKRFDSAYSMIATATVPGKVKDAKGREVDGDVPINPARARAHAQDLVNKLVAQGLTRRMALRVVSAYIKNGGKSPGSFKSYGKPGPGSPAIPGN